MITQGFVPQSQPSARPAVPNTPHWLPTRSTDVTARAAPQTSIFSEISPRQHPFLSFGHGVPSVPDHFHYCGASMAQ
jgi:hypothetical protein